MARPIALVLAILALGLPAVAVARPGDPDRRLDRDGRAIIRSPATATAFAPEGAVLLASPRSVLRVSAAGRVQQRWRVRQRAPSVVLPRGFAGALSVDGEIVRALGPEGGLDPGFGSAGVRALPGWFRLLPVPRPDGDLLLVGFRAEFGDLQVRTQRFGPTGSSGEGALRRATGGPYEHALDAVPDGAGGAWVTVFGGQFGPRATELVDLLRVDGFGEVRRAFPAVTTALYDDRALGLRSAGRLLAVPGGVVVGDGAGLVRVTADGVGPAVRPVGGAGAGPPARLVAVDRRGGLLLAQGTVLHRRLPTGERDPAWPRGGVDLARGLPDRSGPADDPYLRLERARARRDGTVDALVSVGGANYDSRPDLSAFVSAVALVRVEGEDLVRVVRASGGRASVRCLAATRCLVRLDQDGRVLRRGLRVPAGGTRTVRVPLRRGRTLLARATDGRGAVASHRRRVR